jgi:hypothetical protein
MRIDRALIVAGFVLAAAVHRLAAQVPTAAGRDDSLARVIALSLPDELRRRAGQAAADEQAARQLLSQARQEEQRVQTLIEIRRLEFKTLEKHLDLAKQEKRESDRKSLEDSRKSQELTLRMLERWKEVHSVTIRTAELTRDAARESRTAAEAELRLLDLRGTAAGSTEADSAVRAYQSGQQEENLIRQTRVVLEARRSEADLRRQLAERQRDLAEKQLALIEAQLAVRYLR